MDVFIEESDRSEEQGELAEEGSLRLGFLFPYPHQRPLLTQTINSSVPSLRFYSYRPRLLHTTHPSERYPKSCGYESYTIALSSRLTDRRP